MVGEHRWSAPELLEVYFRHAQCAPELLGDYIFSSQPARFCSFPSLTNVQHISSKLAPFFTRRQQCAKGRPAIREAPCWGIR